MERRTVVPNGDRVLLPAEADLVVQALRDHVVEVLQNPLGLGGGHIVNLAGKDRVGEDGLPAGHGVGAHHGVGRVIELSESLATSVGLEDTEDVRRVGGGEALEEGLDRGRKRVVELVAVRPDSVAAGFGDLVKLEDREGGRVRLEGDVRVPPVEREI